MKTKSFAFAALLCILLSAEGCDFLRSVSGRPTSRDIQKKAELIQRELDRKTASLDSMKRIEKQLKDSLAYMDSLKQLKGTVLNPSKLGGLYTTKLESEFYIVIGAFRERVNAETLVKKVSAQGYPATLISFRNGYNVVGICPSNTPQAIYDTLKEVREKDFCPDDVWVLMNE